MLLHDESVVVYCLVLSTARQLVVLKRGGPRGGPHVEVLLCCFLQEAENFLHRSGRTGRAGRAGTAIAMFIPKEYNYFKQVRARPGFVSLQLVVPFHTFPPVIESVSPSL